MNHDELKNAISAYCLGALDKEELKVLEDHLKSGCSECESLLREMQGVVSALPHVAPAKPPPAQLKQKIFGSIGLGETLKTVEGTRTHLEPSSLQLLQKAKTKFVRISWALAFALLLILIGSGWYTKSLQDEINHLEIRLEITAQVVQELESELRSTAQKIRVFESPDVQVVDLKGLEPSPNSNGKVVWDPLQNRAIFYAFDLPQAPSDKDYQLWMIRGSQPIDAGIVSVDAKGYGVSSIETISDSANLSAFAVTLEPKGGVPQPTGAMYLLGVVSRG